MKIDVMIPVYKPGIELRKLLNRLQEQTCKINQIWLWHTEDGYDLQWISALEGKTPVVEVKLRKETFDHGGTRDRAMRKSQADIVICMTQDAVPVNRHLVEHLVKAVMQEPEIAVAYARQTAGRDSNILERYTRKFNYPAESSIKSKADIKQLGIKTYFCSNVCAAYRREIYEELGGFKKHIIFNEDMVFAAAAIGRGYKVAYEASAVVRHSHDYSAFEHLKRNFDLGVSQSCYPEIFQNISSEAEGVRLLKETSLFLLRIKRPLEIIKLGAYSFCKYTGYRLGKKYFRLPEWFVMKLTMNPGYWKKEE